MFSHLLAQSQWIVGALLEAGVFVLAIRRRLFDRLPVFTVYLGLLVAYEATMFSTYALAGARSRTALYVYWLFQMVLVLARAAAVYDICRVLLSPYLGVWKLCRPFLVSVGIVLLIGAVLAARQGGHDSSVNHLSRIILNAGRGLELTVVGILILGLSFCRYYRISVDPYFSWIGIGLGFYSAVQVVNNTFLGRWLLGYFSIWKALGISSFNIATLLWGVALWKPLPALTPSPALMEDGAYGRLVLQVNVSLRSLNARLLEMWK